jgi:hypothetical protein
MRSFGRRCRGQGRVFVTLVRHTEQQLLALAEVVQPISPQHLDSQEYKPISASYV